MNPRTLILLVMAVLISALIVIVVKGRNNQAGTATGPKILVAAQDIAAGSFVQAEKNLAWKEWPESSISPSFIVDTTHKIEEFNGGVSRRDIVAGEPINLTAIVKVNDGGFMSAVLTPGKRAISIAVSPTSGNAGFVFPGDHVDLILTHRLPGDVLASETFIEDVRVLAIDQMLTNPDNKAIVAKTISLEITPKQAEKINVAISIGSISVSLRSLATPNQHGTDSPANDNTVITLPANPEAGNYSTNSDVSKLMGEKKSPTTKISVFHGNNTEQLDFHATTEGKKE